MTSRDLVPRRRYARLSEDRLIWNGKYWVWVDRETEKLVLLQSRWA